MKFSKLVGKTKFKKPLTFALGFKALKLPEQTVLDRRRHGPKRSQMDTTRLGK